MPYPIREVTRPSVLSGQRNGELDPRILFPIPGLAGGPVVTLVEPVARCWRAMAAHAQADGIALQATSAVDSYRPLAVQQAVFRQRYTTQRNRDWEIKVCSGTVYYKRPDVASAACPGTSNHGWASAVDVANASGRRLDWLLAHALDYGWSWELQSEPWHLRQFVGDAIPRAVLAFEEDDMAVTKNDALLIARTTMGLEYGRDDRRASVATMLIETRAYAKAAAEGTVSADDLAAIEAAARRGVLGSVDELVAALVAKLPDEGLTKDDVAAAVREVFADAAAA